MDTLKARTVAGYEPGYGEVTGATFVDGDPRHVQILWQRPENGQLEAIEYTRSRADRWVPGKRRPAGSETSSPDVMIREAFDHPPTLIAASPEGEREIWDPNPQLQGIEWGRTRIYHWTDKKGRQWSGGLFEPPPSPGGRQYPLLIQTHGFLESEFAPSGLYPTAMAARALTAAGFVVLQVDDNLCPSSTAEEAQCATEGYRAVISKLATEDVIDPDRVGLLGFSRTCLYVMQMLAQGDTNIRAASVTDGVMDSYLQYMLSVSETVNSSITDAEGTIGAAPFAKGLETWAARSSTFNLDRVRSPLLVSSLSRSNAIYMWEPYAGLLRLGKPVDFLIIDSNEHVLTNPVNRLVSQGSTVDWFRFWLQGYERTVINPETAETEETLAAQYVRWRKLCDLYKQGDPQASAYCVSRPQTSDN